jgi:aspartate 1-decarboxylase
MATVTEANLKYIGSVTIDSELLEAADILPNEKVQIVNLNNGQRFETYVMKGEAGSGIICMNGAAARWAQVGDNIIIISYLLMEQKDARSFETRVVFVDENNRTKRVEKGK